MSAYRVESAGWDRYLLPADLAKQSLEYVGVLVSGTSRGALARVKSSGKLVVVNAGAMRSVDQSAAESALLAAKEPTYDYTRAERNRRARATGKRLNAVLTDPEAIARLAELVALHGSERAAIEALLRLK